MECRSATVSLYAENIIPSQCQERHLFRAEMLRNVGLDTALHLLCLHSRDRVLCCEHRLDLQSYHSHTGPSRPRSPQPDGVYFYCALTHPQVKIAATALRISGAEFG